MGAIACAKRPRACAIGVMLFVCAVASWAGNASAETDWTYSLESKPPGGNVEVAAEFGIVPSWQGDFIDSFSITVKNRTTATITVIWDSSMIVLPSGESSRVIRAGTLSIAKAIEQAPSPIAPTSFLDTVVWPVELMTEDSFGRIEISDGGTVSLRLAWEQAGERHESAWVWRFYRVAQPELPQAAWKPVAQANETLQDPLVVAGCLGPSVPLAAYIRSQGDFDESLANRAAASLTVWMEAARSRLIAAGDTAEYCVELVVTKATAARPFNWWFLLLPAWPFVPLTSVEASVILSVAIQDSAGTGIYASTAGREASAFLFGDFFSRDWARNRAFDEAFKHVMVAALVS
jgi:hypothetical protein